MTEKLKFRVRLISGRDEKNFNEAPTMTMAALREECFKRFKDVSPAPGQRWIFKVENGSLIDRDDQTLQDAGVRDGSLLLFGSEADILG